MLGSSGTPINLTSSNVYGYIVDMAKLMDEASIPAEDRHLVVNPAVKSLLLQSNAFLRSTQLGDKAVANGAIGVVAGFSGSCVYQHGHCFWFDSVTRTAQRLSDLCVAGLED